MLICGESGIGKTALVEAFRPQVKGARWLWGGCDGLLTPRPLGPLFDIAARRPSGELARGSAARGLHGISCSPRSWPSLTGPRR